MNIITIFLTISAALLTGTLSADAPNWLGIYNIDDSCNQAECCCLSEQTTISKAENSQLLVTANVAGVPCQQQLNGSTTISVLLPIPQDKSGFQITTDFLGTYNRFTLSADSQYIAHVNLQSPRCSAMARRVVSNWLGTFNVDDSCNQVECCCLSEQATISKLSDTQLLVTTRVAGETCKAQLNGSTTIEVPIPIPQDKNGFQITTNFLGTNNRFTLTYDNQYVANVNLQYPRCSGMGRRSS
ncbi:unnamed protein product [Rotaria socialis]|uniref:Uncharacterized protein n=1 Tax=Rotaria socialis TaxID=392032 RepID=A0A820ZS70_9BILA|nr:unnamed protein product [Rotaria socialis]CAF4569345.1 unnamed protein product [Rotaria socialis]